MVLGWREVCCSRCWDGEKSVVHGVMMERGLSLFTVLGWKEVAVCDVKMERGLSLFIILRWKEVCHCSRCWDGEKSVVVQIVRMERGLLLFRLS